MEVDDREKLLEKSNILRQELKRWERDFSSSNGGRKAERDDIKRHPSIALKYKEYNKARDVLAGKVTSQAPSSPQRPKSRKRCQEVPIIETPAKRLAIAQTPLKRILHPEDIDPYDSPSLVRNLFTPSKYRVIGPTPQKDGKALGLFDLLPDEDENSKAQQMTPSAAQMPVATPRKPKDQVVGTPGTSRRRTPASNGKRFMLDTFMTPLKRRNPNEQSGKTPSSVSKLHFLTPAFLRRGSQRTVMPTVVENDDGTAISPEMVKLPKKPLLRGLSSILAGLRKMQEDAADEDLDILREIENEDAGMPKPVGKNSNVQVEDSQVRLPLGGFDDEAMYDSEPEEVKNPPLGRDGQPLKIYKKKGQKRTTRRVVIKPVKSKPQQPTPQTGVPSSPSTPTVPQNDEKIAETQQQDGNQEASEFTPASANFNSDSGTEYTASEGGTRYPRADLGKEKRKVMGKDGKIKSRSMTKTTASSHANFKRLKLRSSGMKGGPAHNSRFRRKR